MGLSSYEPPIPHRVGDDGFVTRGEFRQFERRVDQKLDAITAAITVAETRDREAIWFGPRFVGAIKVILPSLLSVGLGFLIAVLASGHHP